MASNESKIDVAGTPDALRTFEQTTVAGEVHTEAVAIADPENINEVARVTNSRLDVNSKASVVEHTTDTPLRAANGWDITKTTVTTTPSQIPAAPLANRISIEIHNADNNRLVWIGTSSAQIVAGQYRTLEPGESIILELDENVDVWASSDSATADVEIIEVADSTV